MSVAEALGQEVRSPNIEVRRQKHFIGLNNDQPRLIPYESQNDVKETPSSREPLALRKLEDIYSNRREEDVERIKRERRDMEEERLRMQEKHSKQIQDKENERKQNYELSNNFLWDQRSAGHGGPNNSGNYKRRQFLETNSGPSWLEKKEMESNPRGLDVNSFKLQNGPTTEFVDQALPRGKDFYLYDPAQRSESQTPFELQEYSKKLAQVSEQKKLSKERQQTNPYSHAELSHNLNVQDNYVPRYNLDIERFPEEKRSLDLDHTRGGAGAPEKDERGKSVTRRPITLSRDNYGETRIRENVVRLNTGNSERDQLYTEDNKPYFPWGSQGGGAPLRDRDGKIITQVFGKLEGKDPQDEEYRKDKMRKEVFFNELKEVEKQQRENKEELKRYMKAPQVEMAELMTAGRVGKPRRDEVTGYIAQQHLPHTDVVKTKTNYQPKPVNEKKQYHDELVRMAEERQYQKLLDKFKERQESNAHFQNMDTSWGMFGGGAPKHQVIRKKVNLNNALFYPDQANGQSSSNATARTATEEPVVYPSYSSNPPTGLGSFELVEQAHHNAGYQKLFTEDDQRQFHSPENSPRYVRNTMNSSHKNLYQGNPVKLTGRSGQTVPPFATGMM
ncbi:uncharacterized protein LOC106069649 isoform X2 [Biomphalaria glabrata]|uniref:Uncharacterized protein LOC106069649 isoform X2 n=1 Tax=Biomphalaria glabrata TaxID=6526 RepID=A0A9W2YD48_BIOGL|nr:uncharacterized protein LOC106069649 isoform X2 [Biomphalaria glabrata]KAI8743353.1 hypothetical protein BgiMline_021762 [Biomphalaria glabrata]